MVTVTSVGILDEIRTWCLLNKNLQPDQFFFNLCGGILGTAATTGLFYQSRMICDIDCEEIGGIKIGRGNRSTRGKPAPAPLCKPQIPHD
jgi:hypothetical protein